MAIGLPELFGDAGAEGGNMPVRVPTPLTDGRAYFTCSSVWNWPRVASGEGGMPNDEVSEA